MWGGFVYMRYVTTNRDTMSYLRQMVRNEDSREFLLKLVSGIIDM